MTRITERRSQKGPSSGKKRRISRPKALRYPLVWALLASIVLHFTVLWGHGKPPPAPARRARLALRLLPQAEALPSPRSPLGPARPGLAAKGVSAVRSRIVADTSAKPAGQGSPPEEPVLSLDSEALRAQARQLQAEPEALIRRREPIAVGTNLSRSSHETPERAMLPALAKRLELPTDPVSERRLEDGSRMLRFSGGVCLRIPPHLPLGAESAIGPTLLIPTTCPK